MTARDPPTLIGHRPGARWELRRGSLNDESSVRARLGKPADAPCGLRVAYGCGGTDSVGWLHEPTADHAQALWGVRFENNAGR
jgi:hypothetical protein